MANIFAARNLAANIVAIQQCMPGCTARVLQQREHHECHTGKNYLQTAAPAAFWRKAAPRTTMDSHGISKPHIPSTLVRQSCLAPSCGAPPKLFPRFTSHPRSSGTPVSLFPAELPPSYVHASHPIHARPALLSRSFLRSPPQAISTIHIPSTFVRHSYLAPSCGAPPQAISTLHIPFTLVWHSCLAPCCDTPKLFPRFTSHPRSSGTPVSLLPAQLPDELFPRFASHPRSSGNPVSLLPAELPQAISTLHIPSTLVRHSCLAPSCGAPPKLFQRFTSFPRSSGTSVSLLPAELPTPSYFQGSHPIHMFVRQSCLAPSCGAPPKLFPRFTSHPRSSGTPVSLFPAELPPSYFHASHPIHARPSLLSRSFLRSSPPAISKVHIPSICSSGNPVSLLPAELPPSYFHASHPIHARLALLSRSLLRHSQAISTLHIPSTLVRQSCPAPSCGAPPKLFPRFTSHPLSSGTPVSLLPAELPQKNVKKVVPKNISYLIL